MAKEKKTRGCLEQHETTQQLSSSQEFWRTRKKLIYLWGSP